MTTLQALSLVGLAVVLGLGIWRKANVGVIALGAALVLMQLGHVDVAVVLQGFPTDLVLLIIGVTLLFAHAVSSGAIDAVTTAVLRRSRGHRWVVPWTLFGLGVAMATVGGFPSAIAAIVVPVVARVARAERMNYAPMALIIPLGANAAGFSPLGTSGALVHQLAGDAGRSYPTWGLYGLVVGAHLVIAIVVYVVLGLDRFAVGRDAVLVAGAVPGEEPGEDPDVDPGESEAAPRWNASMVASLVAILVLGVAAVAFKLDVGLTALALVTVLQLVFRPDETELIARVPWAVVLLISGLLVYLQVLDQLGTLKAVERALGHVGSASLTVVLLAYLSALVSNFESSTLVVLGVVVPVGLQLVSGSGPVLLAVLFALSMSAAVVTVSPVHVGGALTLANANPEDRRPLFNQLLVLAGVLTVVVPAISVVYPLIEGV